MQDKVTPISGRPGHEWLKFDTEQGVAEHFVSVHGGNVRYVKSSDSFYSWDGKYWKPDADGVTERQMHKCARALTWQALKTADEEQRAKRVKVALQYEAHRKQQAVLSFARKMKPIAATADAFDTDPLLFNVQNGTIELRTAKLRAHRREDMISRISPVFFTPTAQCPTWLQFLADIFCGDNSLVAYIQRAVGYSLTGETREHKIFIPYGKGSNGKTTFTNVIEKVLGDYGATTSAETFIGRKDNAPTNDLARLHNVRYVSAAEAEDNKSLSEAFVKSVTGGDKINARMMYEEFFEFTPMFKLWLSTNYKPNIRGSDDGIWRRLALVPFNAYFPPETSDKAMPDKLESELPGILAWAVQGAKEYLRDGLGSCSAVAGATSAYRSAMDTFGAFIEQCCIEDATDAGFVTSTELRSAYSDWAQLNGERPISATLLGRKMESRVNFKAGKDTRDKRGFFGLRLSPIRPTPQTLQVDSDQTAEPAAHEDSAVHNLWESDTFDAFSEISLNSSKRARRGDFSKTASNASNVSDEDSQPPPPRVTKVGKPTRLACEFHTGVAGQSCILCGVPWENHQ